MKNLICVSLLLTLAVAISYPLAAQEKEGKKGKGKNQAAGQIDGLLKKTADAELSDDQTKKLNEAAETAKKKIKEASEKVGPDVQRELAQAKKQASSEGKKGRELKAAIEAAVKLTPEQKAGLEEIEMALSDFRKAATEILTPEQREKIGLKSRKK